MNLANACYLLKPDSQIISRLCEAAYRGRTAGGPRSTRRGGGVTSPGLPLMQLSFCWSLRHWLWVTAGVNTKSFSFLFWVHRPNSFLLQLPGLGPSCWLILPGFRQPSFTLQAAGLGQRVGHDWSNIACMGFGILVPKPGTGSCNRTRGWILCNESAKS